MARSLACQRIAGQVHSRGYLRADGAQEPDVGPPAEPLTLALAMTETWTLTDALADALTAASAQARALPPALVMFATTALPEVAT